MKQRKRKTRVRTWVLIVVIVISLLGVIYSATNILIWCYNVERNKEIREEIKEYVEEVKIDDNISGVVSNNFKIDFKAVKELNSDTVAYLAVNGLDISNFVVKTKDNSYYLNHNFDKQYITYLPSISPWTPWIIP